MVLLEYMVLVFIQMKSGMLSVGNKRVEILKTRQKQPL